MRGIPDTTHTHSNLFSRPRHPNRNNANANISLESQIVSGRMTHYIGRRLHTLPSPCETIPKPHRKKPTPVHHHPKPHNITPRRHNAISRLQYKHRTHNYTNDGDKRAREITDRAIFIKDNKNICAKPNEQSQTRLSYAVARIFVQAKTNKLVRFVE